MCCMTALLYITLTIHPSYTSDSCMPTYVNYTKMYCSDMSDPPMAANSKASVASEATCKI